MESRKKKELLTHPIRCSFLRAAFSNFAVVKVRSPPQEKKKSDLPPPPSKEEKKEKLPITHLKQQLKKSFLLSYKCSKSFAPCERGGGGEQNLGSRAEHGPQHY